MALATGTRLGPYEILAPLGAGGMGEVYRAQDTRLDRAVAIKVLPSRVADNTLLRQRFEREARALSSLSHPHICTLYDIGHENDVDFLVMEYLEGETLATRLEKGALPTQEVLRYGTEIADALDKAHRQGVIHRDLKPGNIILTKSGAKLLDFGLAKASANVVAAAVSELTAQPTQSQPLTAEGTIVGTFQYMAPEQLEGKEADARTDIFAFGTVLYEMATGRKAFSGKSQATIIAAILTADPPPITTLQPMTPPALDRVAKTCLAKDPDDRFQTAHDLKLQLQWIAEAGSQAGVPAPVVARRKMRERLGWICAGVLALAATALAVAVVHFWRASNEMPVVRSVILPPEKSAFLFAGTSSGPPVISPDGSRLAFVARGPDGKNVLWVRLLSALSAQALAGTEEAMVPFWSADSRFMGFFADGKLKKINPSGGPPQVLCDAQIGRGGSWNREGTIIFSPSVNHPLYRVSAAGGAPTPVTRLDASRHEITHRWPHFLPDGRHFLYYARSGLVQSNGTYLGSLDAGVQKLILRGDSNAVYVPAGYLLFVRDRTLMAQPFDARRLELTGEPVPLAERVEVNTGTQRAIFSASENGVLLYQHGTTLEGGWELRWFDRTGKQGSPVGALGIYLNPRLSPDGKKLAVSINDLRTGNYDIWVYDLTRPGAKLRLTFAPSINGTPVWSPDGARIAFFSSRKGPFHIYQKAANGTGAEEAVLESDAEEIPQSWSRDGRYLAYERRDMRGKQNAEIWVLPLFGDRKPFPVVQSEFESTFPQFSPDGKWLAYTSNESNRNEVYVVPFPGGSGKWQVSMSGGSQPRWRGDGKELFYLAADDKVVAVDVSAKGATLELNNLRSLFQAHPVSTPRWVYDVSADGKRFLVITATEQGSAEPLTLVTNWTAELRK